MTAAKAKSSAITPSGVSAHCAPIFKGFFRLFRAVGVKRPPELNFPAGQAVAPVAGLGQGTLPAEDKDASLSYEFGHHASRLIHVHIDPSQILPVDTLWAYNTLLFHLNPCDLDRLQLHWLHCLVQDYDMFSYKGFFDQMASRCQVFQGPFTPQESMTGILARHQINLNLSPYLEKTFQLFGKAIKQQWQGAVEGRLALMPGVVLFNFKTAMRPSKVAPLLPSIVPSGAGPGEPIHLIMDYSQMPSAEATLAFFFVTTPTPQTFPIKEVTILPRA